MTPVRLQEVEVGRRYRFTFRRPVRKGSRARVVEGVVGAACWGEFPLLTDEGVVRVDRTDITHVRPALLVA